MTDKRLQPMQGDRAKTLHALSHLLQALELSRTPPDPHQYQQLVQRLTVHLKAAQDESLPVLKDILQIYPAAAQLYENINYHCAGLCRSPMEWSVRSDMATQDVLQHAMRSARGQAPSAR